MPQAIRVWVSSSSAWLLPAAASATWLILAATSAWLEAEAAAWLDAGWLDAEAAAWLDAGWLDAEASRSAGGMGTLASRTY